MRLAPKNPAGEVTLPLLALAVAHDITLGLGRLLRNRLDTAIRRCSRCCHARRK